MKNATLNGGKTWSTPFTQPNQQIYRVNVDNQFPYNLYGDCQDLIGYKVPSASLWGGIALSEVTVIGSGESGAAVPHPTDPNIVYHLAQSTFASGGCRVQRQACPGRQEPVRNRQRAGQTTYASDDHSLDALP